LGLVAALDELAGEAQTELGSVEVSAFCDGAAAEVAKRLNRQAALHIYRIAQEALHNASKHGGATAIALRLTTDLSAQPSVNSLSDARLAALTGRPAKNKPQALIFEARDDGQGMPLPVDHGALLREGRLGLAGMRERAAGIGATLRFQQGREGGMLIRLTVPLTDLALDLVEQSLPNAPIARSANSALAPSDPISPAPVFQVFEVSG
ncbi:MAG TPA: hypothetical protein VKQ36_06400, partial [Ktedonobacterales bacterium]|nr:hypothetical protein [Ktedonobacterales bacterium]